MLLTHKLQRFITIHRRPTMSPKDLVILCKTPSRGTRVNTGSHPCTNWEGNEIWAVPIISTSKGQSKVVSIIKLGVTDIHYWDHPGARGEMTSVTESGSDFQQLLWHIRTHNTTSELSPNSWNLWQVTPLWTWRWTKLNSGRWLPQKVLLSIITLRKDGSSSLLFKVVLQCELFFFF